MSSRRWFQLHLSTLIVLSFVAGGLIKLNLHKSELTEEELLFLGGSPSKYFYVQGWPVPFRRSRHLSRDEFSGERVLEKSDYKGKVLVIELVEDISVWVLTLCIVAYFSEQLIRRRKPLE